MSTTIKHDGLGELKGQTVAGTVQFLGVKYASLKNRLEPAVLADADPSHTFNATKYGPPPVSPTGAINREFGFIQHSLPLPNVPTHSDLLGLNLNITVPMNQNNGIDTNANLPVYVFIHGGGFAVGSSWYPHYNQAPLVKLSAEKGKPMIGVTINYRLGLTGFMTSKELRAAGYQANNGFHDQRIAMKWIKKFIGGFGGNPEEITTVGESAGGLAVTMFLCSQEPIMKRCLSTGGTILLLRPLSLDIAEATYQKIIDALGLADKSVEERIQALLTMPMDDTWQKVPLGTPLMPVADGDIIPGFPDFKTISSQEDHPSFPMPGRKWCSALMVGESKLDASILAYMGIDALAPNIAQKFIASASTTLSSHPDAAAQLFAAYNITPATPDDAATLSVLRFASEISFYAPARAFAQGWPKTDAAKFFLYHFNEENPWEGRFQGEAGHIMDVALLFQNFNEFLNDAQRKVATAYAEDFINYVNGEDPWPPVQDGRMGARVYGPSSEGVSVKYVEDGEPAAVGRDERVLRLGEVVGFDALAMVFQNFLQGR